MNSFKSIFLLKLFTEILLNFELETIWFNFLKFKLTTVNKLKENDFAESNVHFVKMSQQMLLKYLYFIWSSRNGVPRTTCITKARRTASGQRLVQSGASTHRADSVRKWPFRRELARRSARRAEDCDRPLSPGRPPSSLGVAARRTGAGTWMCPPNPPEPCQITRWKFTFINSTLTLTIRLKLVSI